MTQIRVVAVVVDKQQAEFYKEDGSTVIVKQGDIRLAPIIDKVIEITNKGDGSVAVVDFDDFNVFKDFEEKSSGIVKFFKVAKSALKSFFGGSEPETTEIVLPPPVQEPAQPANTGWSESVSSVPDEPVEAPEPPTTAYADVERANKFIKRTPDAVPAMPMAPIEGDTIASDETVVAVIGDTIVPHVEQVKPYLIHSLKVNSTVGVENFLKRMAAVAPNRRHSIPDLMRFLERGDLPLADDGSIIAYKVLRTNYNKKNEYPDHPWVDCHTSNVPQRVGSYVCVNEGLVDLNRQNECSNGLHIARRGYLSGFSGDVCTIIKLDPEDVMTVPHGDANKVRVKGYHILGQVTGEAYEILKSNKPMTSVEAAAKLLAKVIKGDHVPRLEEVKINGQKGANIVITPLYAGGQQKSKPLTDEDRARAKAVDPVDEALMNANPVNPRDVNLKVNDKIKQDETVLDNLEKEITQEASKLDEPGTPIGTIPEGAKETLVSVTPSDGAFSIREKEDPKEAKRRRDREYKARKKAEKEAKAKPISKPKAEPKAKKAVAENPIKDPTTALPSTPKEWARYYYSNMQWKDLLTFKKAKKVGWERLGFTPQEIDRILANIK